MVNFRSSPVVQSAERLTLTQEVDGANPSGASISPVISTAGNGVSRGTRHIGQASVLNDRSVQTTIMLPQLNVERRASNAEAAGETPAGSTTNPRVAQSSRGGALRMRRLQVRILPRGPFFTGSEPDQRAGTRC
jgi:hypothetical protein